MVNYIVYTAKIVCKKWFLFQVEMKKRYWKCWLRPSNRPNQQINPYPTRWHYPLITYLTLTCSSIIESISENEINQHDMEHSLIFILFKETLDIHKYFVWIYIDSDGLKIEHQSRDICTYRVLQTIQIHTFLNKHCPQDF